MPGVARDPLGVQPDFSVWAALGPCCAVHRWPQGGGSVTGREGCLRPLLGNGPSLLSLQLLSAGAGPNGDHLSPLQCAEPWGTSRPLGGKELLPTSPVLTVPGAADPLLTGVSFPTALGHAQERDHPGRSSFAGMSVAIGAAFPLWYSPRVQMWLWQMLVLAVQRNVCCWHSWSHRWQTLSKRGYRNIQCRGARAAFLLKGSSLGLGKCVFHHVFLLTRPTGSTQQPGGGGGHGGMLRGQRSCENCENTLPAGPSVFPAPRRSWG